MVLLSSRNEPKVGEAQNSPQNSIWDTRRKSESKAVYTNLYLNTNNVDLLEFLIILRYYHIPPKRMGLISLLRSKGKITIAV